MKYSFADLTVEIKNRYDFVRLQCADYECETIAPADISVCVTDEDIRRERLVSEGDYSDGYLESVCTYRNLCNQLPMFDAKDVQNIADFNTGINFFGINLLNKPDGSSFDSFIWVIPVIAAITALIPIFFKKLNGAMAAPVEGPGKGCNKILPVVFVGLFIWMVWANPAALGIYYIISNVFRLIQSYIINKFYNINIYNAKCEAARIALLEQEEANVKQDFSLKRDFKINNNNKDKKKK